MVYAKIKNPEEYKRLDDALKVSKSKSWYRRLEVIQNSAKGIIVPKLSEIFGICQQTIRNYINAYNQGGLDELMPDKQTGRPPKIGHWTKEDWDKVLEQIPNQYEKLKTQSRQWTLERLALYLKEYHGIEVTLQSVSNSLRKTGRRTGRSKLRVGSPDPDYTVKRAGVKAVQNFALEGQLTSAAVRLIVPDKHMLRIYSKKAVDSEPPADSVVKVEISSKEAQRLYIHIPKLRGKVFFFDEANVSWCPQTGRIYRVKGEEYKVDTPGKNQTKYILGSLEYPTCSGLYEIYPRKRHQEFQSHLEHLLNENPDDFLFVVRDSASQHVTEDMDAFLLSKSDRLCLVPLPTYSPHLNLIERLWHYMRDNITRSYFYGTFTELCETLTTWLKELPDERFLSLIGLSP